MHLLSIVETPFLTVSCMKNDCIIHVIHFFHKNKFDFLMIGAFKCIFNYNFQILGHTSHPRALSSRKNCWVN